MSTESNADLELTAFCYLTGDLTPDAAAAFELQLADDQTARDAVCRMAAMTEKLVTASGCNGEPVSPRKAARDGGFRSRKPFLRRVTGAAAWTAFGAVTASLCFALADYGQSPQIVKSQNEPGTSAAATADPLAWAQLRSTARWPSELQPSPDLPVTAVLKPVIEPASDGLPSWLLASIPESPQKDEP